MKTTRTSQTTCERKATRKRASRTRSHLASEVTELRQLNSRSLEIVREDERFPDGTHNSKLLPAPEFPK